MTNKYRLSLVVFSMILLLVVLICLFFFVFSDNEGNKTAYVYSEGKLLYIIDLDSDNGEFEITTENGYNIVSIKDGKIGIIEADCPDKTCVKTGFTDNPFIPVICMPHRLEIVIEGNSPETDGVSR